MTVASVIIPAYNAEKSIESCLNALHNQTDLEEQPEIIVVDDGSTDNTSLIVKKHEGVVLIQQKNSGPGAARNAGLQEARGRFLLFTDSDCIPAPNWVAEMIKAFEIENIALVIGYTTSHYGKDNFLSKVLQGRDLVGDKPGPINRFNSNNLALHRDIAQAYPFDESLRIYGEDSDLGWRILQDGYKTHFCPTAKINHYHPLTFISFFKNGYLEGIGSARLHYKHNKWIPRDLASFILALFSFLLIPFSRLFILLSGTFFLLFIATLMFNELYYKKKPIMMSFATLPLQFSWYMCKVWGYLVMMFRIFLRLERQVISAKRRFHNAR